MTEGIYITTSVEETQQLAFFLGQYVQSPFCVALIGDLGAGKTHFSQGFAKGLGVTEHITSPTFTLMNAYETGREPFYHFDLYRVDDSEELPYIGFSEYTNKGISLVEWADKFCDEMPLAYGRIIIEITGETNRRIRLQNIPQDVLKEVEKAYALRD